MQELRGYHVGFSHCLGIGPVRFAALCKSFPSLKHAYEANEQDLARIIGAKTAQGFCAFRKTFRIETKLQELSQKGIHVLIPEDTSFPHQLRNISDPPICLYVKGDLETHPFDDRIFFGVVGTRKPTEYGLRITHLLATELAHAGCVIVSGLALGIDAAAHEAALEVGSSTIAVLGCGVDIVYPRSNARIYHQIVTEGGLVISEFPPGRTVLKGLFVARNRIISGLSRGILVVEGTADSGSLITARYASVQGKDVFAPPSPLTSRVSAAPNLLIKEGARMVTSVQDIFEEFGLQVSSQKKKEMPNLTPDEARVYHCILEHPCTADDLARSCSIPPPQILSLVSSLELCGVIIKNAQGEYELARG